MKKNTIIVVYTTITTLILSCSKSVSNSSLNYSNWTITNSPVTVDNDKYISHSSNSVISSRATWYANNNYFMCNGYVYDNNGNNVKNSYALIKFASKPTSNGTYTISPTSTNLSATQCYLKIQALNSGGSTYEANLSTQTVDVSISNGLVIASFNNLSFSGVNSNRSGTFTANASGSILEDY